MRTGFSMLVLAALAHVPAEAQSGAKLSGRVVHSVTNAPVPRAIVELSSLFSGGRISATTDAGGNFTFGALAAGTYRLSARRAGFIDTEFGARDRQSPPTPIRLTDAQDLSGITVPMVPQGVLVVKVAGEDGEPVHGAPVQVMTRTATADGRSRVHTVSEGRTNDLGEYRAASLAPGSYFIAAGPAAEAPSAPRPREQGLTADEHPAPTFYPDVSDPAKAAAMRLEAGQEVPVAISIQPGKTYRIRGTLPAPKPGASFTGLQLVADETSLSGGLGQRATGALGEDGGFEISGVLPGAYSVVLLGNGGPNDIAGAAKVELSDRDLEAVSIAPIEMLTVPGRIRVEGENTVNYSGMRISFIPADELTIAMSSALANRTFPVAPDGTFTIPGVPQGRYRVQATGSFGEVSFLSAPLARVYLKTVQLGERDVTKALVDLTAASAAPALQLTFSPKAASLGVIAIYPAETAPRGTALYVPEPYPADPRLQTSGFTALALDQTGYAQANNMPPGRYRVYALETYDPAEGISEKALKALESRSEVINLIEGGFERVNVKQIPAADTPR